MEKKVNKMARLIKIQGAIRFLFVQYMVKSVYRHAGLNEECRFSNYGVTEKEFGKAFIEYPKEVIRSLKKL